MNYSKPISFVNPNDNSEKVVILGEYICIPHYLPFHKDSELNPVNMGVLNLSSFILKNYKDFLSKTYLFQI